METKSLLNSVAYPDKVHLVWQIGQGFSKVPSQGVIWREAIL